MEPLPYIDDHVRLIVASPERVWPALLGTMRSQSGLRLPKRLVAAWGLAQSSRKGNWTNSVSAGDTVPGFEVADTDPPRLLALRGRHRFSHYELRFELDSIDPHRTQVHARTSAVFPGACGRIYRALVISSGGHRLAVRRMLKMIAGRAERQS